MEKAVEDEITENEVSNYPNPFNPTTTINFKVKETGNVNIIIYDALGREVKQLVNETKQPGSYNISFDGSRLSSGIYFYTMRANNFTASKKMLLTK
ncbi:MAG: T9SS type A sorting domain-containing protein [Ignavibacteriales bacterium]|nr:T9SS type A sorting domain-containing protein [Ignavibacteriales bacterium]